jgi:very-short-patch-repair endonuclease
VKGTADPSKISNGNVLQDRAVRLFKFLRELAQLKTRIVRDLSEYEQVVWFCEIPEHKACFSILGPESETSQDTVWLEVRKSPEPKRPPIPTACQRWLEDTDEDNPEAEPKLRDEITSNTSQSFGSESNPHPQDKAFTPSTERLSDHPEVLEEWDRWKQHAWRPWLENHRRWKAADDIYLKLFSIHQQLKKLAERYELLLGLGLLTWETPSNQVIRRHVIVGNAYLTFDANKAKFELQAAPEGVKLNFETEMIDQNYLPSPDQQKELESMLSLVQESPWNKDEIDNILRSFIHSISPQGVYSDSPSLPDKPSKTPTVTFAPAIILRQRTQKSQVQCFSSVIEQINNGGDTPSGIKILCEEPVQLEESGENHKNASTQFTDETLYLPLPVNDEQKQIIFRIHGQQGILVQGPPGTGKSHTIANIICHLLAQGKRVLVTSQTPRALKVLKEKIPAEMAALCVTLLGNDQAARQELEESVSRINQKYSDWNQEKNRALIAGLEQHLYELRKDKADKERLLRERREIDTYRHEVAGGSYRGTAQQIAQRVASEESKFAWLEDAIDNDGPCPLSNDEFRELLLGRLKSRPAKGPCPLSNDEFRELLRLYRELPEDYCLELRKELISRESIPDISVFIQAVDDERRAKQDLAEYESRRGSLRYRILQQLTENDIKSLHKAISGLMAAIGSIKARFAWVQQAVFDILAGNDAPWKSLHGFMVGHLSELKEKATVAQELDVQFPDHLDRKKLRADALDLVNHLKTGGKIDWGFWGFLAPQVVKRNRYITKEVRINGHPCTTLERLRLLITYLETLDKIDSLWSALQGKDKREEGSLLLQVGYLQERLEALEELLSLEKHLSLARESLKVAAGLPEPQWHKVKELEEMITDIQAIECELAFKRARSVLENAIRNVRIAQSSPRSHGVNQEILTALENRDAQALARCLEKLESLERGRTALHRREALHDRLSKVAPKLARQLQDTSADSVWDERASAFEAAWTWKLADKWLKNFRKEHDEARLEADLKQLLEEERKTISKLAAAKAWDSCLRNLTDYRRSNLIAWATTMKKIGKGTGKRAPMYRKQAQEYMDNCKGAIPAWIMPLYRVFETVSPEPEAFDVVIIDEASQTGPEGLIIGYLGKQCIVVGDSEQIAPEAVGVDRSEVDTLAKKYLEGIPFKDRYELDTSLFKLAEILYKSKIVLREHFRCMPEIIQFSNELCYKATPLKPLRQYPPGRLEPILVRHVKNGFREGSNASVQNRPEADALVETVVKMCSSREYAGKTIGVISLQAEAQAKYIEKKLMTRLNPADLESRRIVCGDAYAFQGDERDVILLSMVAAPNERIGRLNKEPDKRRFNVAASRAKDQVALFHTATLSDLHPECMRYKLLEYYLNPIRQPYGVDLSKCESQFERDVCQAIISKGYKVIPQYKVAEYRIDLVVEGTRSQLAVECDGDEWHGIEQYESDVVRQRILERCGWRFWRIRGHEYYRNPGDSLKPLWELLSSMGIKPASSTELDGEVLSETREDGKNESHRLPDMLPENVEPERATIEEEETVSQTTPDVTTKKCLKETNNSVEETETSAHSEIYGFPPQFFFELAHQAKEKEQLEPWERSLIFKVGLYRTHGWRISEKMERHAIRIIQTARQSGLV